MHQIEINAATKSFTSRGRDIAALSETNLDISRNETVCLVGPSGCGKTTLLNLIAGFVFPTEGSISVGGSPITGPGSDRAVVFQEDAVFPWMTVQENIAFGPRSQHLPNAIVEERVQRFLELVNLHDFRTAHPKELSGGMRKRVDIARAYASEPDVLLLDEPFGALDHFTKEEMWMALRELKNIEPKTILFVTHDIEEALYMGDRVVVMTARPARVHTIVEVPFGGERSLDLRASTTFQDLRLSITRSLMEVNSVQ